jgi:hypothetical protein
MHRVQVGIAQALAQSDGVAALIVAANLARRNLSRGQQSMALAMIYPDPEKTAPGKRSSHATLSEPKSVSAARLSQTRTVLHHSRALAEDVLAGGEYLDAALETVRKER